MIDSPESDDRDGGGSTAPSHAEQLLRNCLEQPPELRAQALEDECRRHPELAGEIRALFSNLVSVGLVSTRWPADAAAVPDRLGEFRLLRLVGGGGMGVVYLAEQEGLQRRVALKLIRPEQLFFPGARERFQREARAIASLEHPGVVSVFSVGEARGIPYLAMEWVEGKTLAEVLDSVRGRSPGVLSGRDLARAVGLDPGCHESRLPELFEGNWVQSCLRLVAQVAESLAHAHGREIVHRDVKPSNIMITGEGRVLLMDFGLAQTGETTRITRSGTQPGSLPYMSPEQARGDATAVDGRSDVYSLGVTLYELLTLQLPFLAETADGTRQLILAGRHTPVREHNAGVSWEAATVCHAAMECDREQRYANALALHDDLRNVLELRPINARPPGAWLRLRRAVQRRPGASAAIVLGAVLVLGAPTALWLQQQAANEEIGRRQRVAEAEAARAKRLLGIALGTIERMVVRVGAVRLRDVPRFERERLAILGDALPIYDALLEESRDLERVVTSRAEALRRYATLLADLGRYEEAEGILRDQIGALAAAIDGPGGDEALVVLADDLGQLGSLLCARGAYPEAVATLQERTERLAMLAVRRPRDSRVPTMVGEAWYALGDALDRAGDFSAAVAAFEEAGRVFGALRESAATATVRMGSARTGQKLATSQVQLGRLVDAEGNARAALALFEELVAEDPDDTRHRSGLAECVALVATILERSGRPRDAEPWFRRSIDLRRGIADDFPEIRSHGIDLVVQLFNTGRSLMEAGRRGEGRALLQEAIERGERLLETGGEQMLVSVVASAYSATGRADDSLDRPARIAALRRATELGERVFDWPLEHYVGRRQLALSYQWLGRSLAANGATGEAEAALLRALECFELPVEPDLLGPRHWYEWSGTLRSLGDLYREAGREDLALARLEAGAICAADGLARCGDRPGLVTMQQLIMRDRALLLARREEFETCIGLVDRSLVRLAAWAALQTGGPAAIYRDHPFHEVVELAARSQAAVGPELTVVAARLLEIVQEEPRLADPERQAVVRRCGRSLIESLRIAARDGGRPPQIAASVLTGLPDDQRRELEALVGG